LNGLKGLKGLKSLKGLKWSIFWFARALTNFDQRSDHDFIYRLHRYWMNVLKWMKEILMIQLISWIDQVIQSFVSLWLFIVHSWNLS
jgi:hypothetical protein